MLEGQTAAACSLGIQFFVDWTNPLAKYMYALALTAYQSGDLVAVNWYCGTDGTAIVGDMDARK